MKGIPVLYTIMQSGYAANGGIASISNVILSLRDHCPIILTNLETPQTEIWRKAGVEVHVVPENASAGIRRGPLGYAKTYIRYHRAVRNLLRKTQARVVHANDPLAFQLSLSAVKASRKTKIAFNLRDTIDPGRSPPSLRYKYLFGSADHIFYLSRDMAERWQEVAPNATHSYTITYSIVDFDRFHATPQSQGAAPIVLLSGILCPKKGQLNFLQHVAPELARHGIRIWIAGDFHPDTDSYAAACSEVARPLGAAVTFLGYQSDLPSLLAQSSVIAIASEHEGLVRSMIEGMSCARPVVSFAVCSAREVLETLSGGSGVVVEPRDYEGMTAAIMRFCFDEQERRRAGDAGAQAAVRLFQREKVVRSYENAYRAMILS